MWEAIYLYPAQHGKPYPRRASKLDLHPRCAAVLSFRNSAAFLGVPKLTIQLTSKRRNVTTVRKEASWFHTLHGRETLKRLATSLLYIILCQIQRHEDSLVWRLLLPSHSSIRDESFCHCQSSGLSQVLAHITKQHCHVVAASWAWKKKRPTFIGDVSDDGWQCGREKCFDDCSRKTAGHHALTELWHEERKQNEKQRGNSYVPGLVWV